MALFLIVLVPVLIITIVNFYILYANNYRSIQQSLRIESERTLETLNTHLDSMHNIVSLKRKDKTFSVDSQWNIGSSYYPIIQSLQRDAIWTSFFSGISYYNVQNNMVYRLNSAISADEYFVLEEGKPRYYSDGHLGVKEGKLESLKETGNHTRTFRVRNTEGNGSGVLFAVPLETYTDEPPASYMIFMISDDMLFNTINAKEGTDCVLYYNGTPIYSSDPEVCEAIYQETYDVKETGYSRQLVFSNSRVRIAWNISSRFLAQNNMSTIIMETLVIFLVIGIGFNNLLRIARKSYEPVQNLMNRFAPDTNPDELVDEFQYLTFMMDDLEYSKGYYEDTAQMLRREKMIYQIFDNQVSPERIIYKQCLNAGIRVDRKYFSCIMMEDTEKNFELYEWLISERKAKDLQIDAYSLFVLESKYLFLLASDMEIAEFEKVLQQLAGDDKELVMVGDIVEGIENVRQSYLSLGKEAEDSIDSEGHTILKPLVEIQFLKEALEMENTDKLEFALHMIKNNLSTYSDEQRRDVMNEIHTMLQSELAESEKRSEHSFDSEKECSQALDEWIAQCAKANETDVKVSKTLPRNLHTIMHFIEENYTKPEFSIKYMAAYFDTSSSNLSHQFKKMTGKTLSRFIDELRISRADEMLRNGEKIHVIAQSLGYNSTPAFTETYKRYRGTTPSKNRGQL